MKLLISNGDSWTYGSDLHDPEVLAKIDKTKSDWYRSQFMHMDRNKDNHPYRIVRSYPYLLAAKFGARSINLAAPADNNNFIAERTIDFISKHKLSGPKVFVVIGWTAPERNDFYMDVQSDLVRHRIFNIDHVKDVDPFFKKNQAYREYLYMHFGHLIVPDEYWTRYVKNIAMLELFLKEREIPYLMFNAFYPSEPDKMMRVPWRELYDVNVSHRLQEIRNIGYDFSDGTDFVSGDKSLDCAKELWKSVDAVRYYNKDRLKNSFRSFVADRLETPFFSDCGHPTEEAHRLWADELYRYIEQHRLTVLQ